MKIIDFMGQRKMALVFSAILLAISIGSLATKQLNWGLDFTGGTLVEVHYSETADLTAIRNIVPARPICVSVIINRDVKNLFFRDLLDRDNIIVRFDAAWTHYPDLGVFVSLYKANHGDEFLSVS